MNTIILKVVFEGVNTEQWFVDDIEGARKEAEYWLEHGCDVQVTQCIDTPETVN